MGLSRAVIGVLPDDDDSDVLKRGLVEGIEDQRGRRIDGNWAAPLFFNKGCKLLIFIALSQLTTYNL